MNGTIVFCAACKSAMRVGVQGQRRHSGRATVDFAYSCHNPDCASSVIVSEQAILQALKTNLESLQTAPDINQHQLALILALFDDPESNWGHLRLLIRGAFVFLVTSAGDVMVVFRV